MQFIIFSYKNKFDLYACIYNWVKKNLFHSCIVKMYQVRMIQYVE